MSYQVLARKLRPATFDALVGQEHVVRAMVHALENDRLHHAYLFTGTRGVGKTTIARILARCLNCETGVTATPCGTCTNCVEILEGRFVDLIEVDAASRTGVADTRDLLDNAQYLPTRGRYKVYLIDEVHMLSTAAFNALLKTLEEPPEHVKFVLATTDPKKVPVTVLSRCLQFQLKNLTAEEIDGYLGQILDDEAVTHDHEGTAIIADAARGSMRDALSITDQAIAFGGGSVSGDDVKDMLGVVGRDETRAVIAALASGDAARLLDCCAALYERNVDFAGALENLVAELHRQAIRAALNEPEPGDLAAEVIQLYYQIAIMGTRDLAMAPDPRCGFEMTVLRMLHFTPNDEELVGRVEPESGVDAPERQSPAAHAGADAPDTVQGARDESSDRRAMEAIAAPSTTEQAPEPTKVAPPVSASVDETTSVAESDAEVSEQRVVEQAEVVMSPEYAPEARESEPELPAVPAQTHVRGDAESGSGAIGGAGPDAPDTTGGAPVGDSATPDTAGRDAADQSGRADRSAGMPDRRVQDHDDWADLVARCDLGGVARMIAEHSVLADRSAGRWRLCLDAAHDTLLNASQAARVERMVQELVDPALTVVIELGEPVVETPAERSDRIAAERLRQAEDELRSDQTIRALLTEFEGSLSGVVPVDPPEPGRAPQ